MEPSHTATATLVLHVLPADLRPPWFLPCSYSDGYVCIQAQYNGAVPTGHTLVTGVPGEGCPHRALVRGSLDQLESRIGVRRHRWRLGD